MNKAEFIAELKDRLAVLTEAERQDILDEYEQHIDIKVMRGMSEDIAIADFGRIEELAADILEAYHVRADYVRTEGARDAATGVMGWLNEAYESVWSGLRRIGIGVWKLCGRAGRWFGRSAGKAGSAVKSAVLEIAAFCKRPFQRANAEMQEGAEEPGICGIEQCDEETGIGNRREERRTEEIGMGSSRAERRVEETGTRKSRAERCAEETGMENRGIGRHAEENGMENSGTKRRVERIGKNAAVRDEERKYRMKHKTGFSLGKAVGRSFGACVEAVLWCIRWIWNLFCIGAGLLFGLGSCMVIFVMGVLVVLLVLGYPLAGVTIGWLGLTMCMAAVTIWCFSMIVSDRKRQRQRGTGTDGDAGTADAEEAEAAGILENTDVKEEEMIHA